MARFAFSQAERHVAALQGHQAGAVVGPVEHLLAGGHHLRLRRLVQRLYFDLGQPLPIQQGPPQAGVGRGDGLAAWPGSVGTTARQPHGPAVN